LFGYGELELQNSGDDGVDIVTVKSFRDRQASQLVILSQCAIGLDWREKRSELDLDVWQRHIRWATKPAKAFVVPFHIDRDGAWPETAVRGGIIFDRGRLVNFMHAKLNPDLKAGMRDWTERRRTSILDLGVQ
jgi:hypothetical protein